MNIEDFNSCLSYIQALPAKKDLLDTLLPAVTTLAGILLGFGINSYKDHSKEKTIAKNKQTCISEEITRTHKDLAHVFEQCILLHENLLSEEGFVGHSLPLKINTFYIDNNFISVAHRFSTLERGHMASLQSLLGQQNTQLKSLHETYNPNDLEDWKNLSLNTLNTALYCIRFCRSFLYNTKDTKLTLVDLADEIGITSTFIEHTRNQLKARQSKDI